MDKGTWDELHQISDEMHKNPELVAMLHEQAHSLPPPDCVTRFVAQFTAQYADAMMEEPLSENPSYEARTRRIVKMIGAIQMMRVLSGAASKTFADENEWMNFTTRNLDGE
jgi:hypothetical protein